MRRWPDGTHAACARPRPQDADVRRDLAAIAAHARRTLLFCAAALLPLLMLWCDVYWLRDGVGERSLVELTQECFLAATVLAFARLARHARDERAFAVLAAGLFACMLVRELDAVFDVLLFHGAWVVPAGLLAVGCCLYALRDWRGALSSLARFVQSRQGAVLTLGLVVVVAYSRLFGVSAIWQGLLGDQYLRVFKNAAEESIELLGYTCIAAAALSYVTVRLRASRRGALPVPIKASL
ncbi:hypothetical protein [Luteimonas lutimaris]|uniref:Uncharacterized protein n=1 Tax=Luteimonas lutimaris TaxID=698645 RepID=A0ABP7M462_9GAMM